MGVHTKGLGMCRLNFGACALLIQVYKLKIDIVHWCVLNTIARMRFRRKDYDKMVLSFMYLSHESV
jgi:hypothetical protein